MGESARGKAMDLFDVYVLRFDVNEERATRGLMQVFGMSEAAARIFVHSVPRVGKRDVPTPTAERYVRALHAVGAVVECRRSGASPLGDSANRVQNMSLPAPTTSSFPGAGNPPTIMQDSLGIMAPLAYSPDMPLIPKAPRIPADLHAIRARKGPDSMAPNWRSSDGAGRGSSGMKMPFAPSAQPANNSLDAGMWSPEPTPLKISSDPLTDLQSPFRGQMAVAGGAANDLARDSDKNGLPNLPSSPTPLSPSPFAPSGRAAHENHDDDDEPWYATATHQLLLAALIIGGMLLALSSGVFQTDASRLSRAFRQAGIDAGTYELAERFLQRPGSQFNGVTNDELRAQLDRFSKAGAQGVWVSEIQQHGEQRSSRTLLLELPTDRNARRSVFEAIRSDPKLQGARPADSGQHYLRIGY
jgi:hypothetical protein